MALAEAREAFAAGEVPIGAVVVCNAKVIAKAHNQTELLHDVTAHAEILAISAATEYLNAKYLRNCSLYVTVEPCVMCAGAMRWAQLTELIFATNDDKFGFTKFNANILHPKTTVTTGICADEAAKLMRDFFLSKRK